MRIILVGVAFFLVYSCSCLSRKESVIAGYSVGSVMTHTIELFVDSTYYMSNGNLGKWMERNDTVFLIEYDSISGFIVDGSAVAINPKYWQVEHFIYRRFNPAIVVDFPH